MIDEILVHFYAAVIHPQMYPVFLRACHRMFPLFQEEDIGCDGRSGIRFERSVRQPDCPDQLRPFSQVLPDSRILLVHRPLRSDEGNHAARPHLIRCLAEEVIMDQPWPVIVFPVKYLEVTERDISDCCVEKAVRKL